jgi:hypothetical protein
MLSSIYSGLISSTVRIYVGGRYRRIFHHADKIVWCLYRRSCMTILFIQVRAYSIFLQQLQKKVASSLRLYSTSPNNSIINLSLCAAPRSDGGDAGREGHCSGGVAAEGEAGHADDSCALQLRRQGRGRVRLGDRRPPELAEQRVGVADLLPAAPHDARGAAVRRAADGIPAAGVANEEARELLVVAGGGRRRGRVGRGTAGRSAPACGPPRGASPGSRARRRGAPRAAGGRRRLDEEEAPHASACRRRGCRRSRGHLQATDRFGGGWVSATSRPAATTQRTTALPGQLDRRATVEWMSPPKSRQFL